MPKQAKKYYLGSTLRSKLEKGFRGVMSVMIGSANHLTPGRR